MESSTYSVDWADEVEGDYSQATGCGTAGQVCQNTATLAESINGHAIASCMALCWYRAPWMGWALRSRR